MVKTGKLRAGVVTRTAEDWEEAALDAIAADGVGSVAVPELARTLGVTKGSFYWHFTSLQSLIDKALQRWEKADEMVLAQVGEIADARQRLVALFQEAMHQQRAHALYITLATSASPHVSAALRRVSERRMKFLIAAYRDLGMSSKQALDRARLTYAAYIGLLHLRRQSLPGLRTAGDVDGFLAQAVETLIPATPRRK